MIKYKLEITGSSPLLMKSTKGVNPLHPMTKELKSFTSKRVKTDEDYASMFWIDYQLGAYYDETLGMYLPAEVLEACIREGAKANRLGEKSKVAVFILDDKIALEYDGPKDIKRLYDAVGDKFKDIRAVTVNKSKVMRCRPRFEAWGLTVELHLDEKLMNPEQLQNALLIAGTQKGLGDYRPRYGRFTASLTEIA